MFNEFVECWIKQCLVDTPSKHDFYLFEIKIIQSSIKKQNNLCSNRSSSLEHKDSFVELRTGFFKTKNYRWDKENYHLV